MEMVNGGGAIDLYPPNLGSQKRKSSELIWLSVDDVYFYHV